MRPTYVTIAVQLIAALTEIAFGQPSVDTVPVNPTSVDQDFSRWCDVGPHHFIFEKTTLDDILRTFGSGRIERDGDAGSATFQYFIRYRWKDQVINFSSNNDMGGPARVLEEVDIQPARNSADELRLPSIGGLIHFPFGEPGMSFQDLEARLGKTL
jgi:hypothetical protein